MQQRIIEEVKKQGEQRTKCRFIMYVPGIPQFSVEEYSQGADVVETLQKHKISKEQEIF